MLSRLSYINLTLFCLVLSFGAQLIGFAVPGWLSVRIDTSFLYEHVYENVVSQTFALWYVVICVNGTCQTKSYEQLQKDGYKNSEVEFDVQDSFDYDFTAKYSRFPFSRLLEFQIETACAVVLVLMGLILVRKQKKCFLLYMSGRLGEDPRLSRFCMVFCYSVISGALILVPTSTFIDVNEDLRALSDNFDVGVPYALICGGAGGILALLSCFFIIGTMCMSISIEDYSSENISVAVNGNNQSVPLVQSVAETSTGGFTQSVSPRNTITDGNKRRKTVVLAINTEKRDGNNHLEGKQGKSVCDTNYARSSENIELPAPDYNKCVQKYSCTEPT
ncbi:uncharacterized protein LOC128545904 [Mercenaria mercenaria]|uniref:uncharacterized protein LOC128545904 n=1 Tax=Mercenaria mercenaria TaxID=6596 RepID=UPI00234F32B3|nr:uncharacterized protein LOC128545904 [Mercenaria mercenaria]